MTSDHLTIDPLTLDLLTTGQYPPGDRWAPEGPLVRLVVGALGGERAPCLPDTTGRHRWAGEVRGGCVSRVRTVLGGGTPHGTSLAGTQDGEGVKPMRLLRTGLEHIRSLAIGAAVATALVVSGQFVYSQFQGEDESTASFAVVSGVTIDVVPAAIFGSATWTVGDEDFFDEVTVTNTSVTTAQTISILVSATEGGIPGLNDSIQLWAEQKASLGVCSGGIGAPLPLEGDPLSYESDFVLAPGASQVVCFRVKLIGDQAPDGSSTDAIFAFTGTP